MYPSAPPTERNKVIITFLSDDFIADSKIDLGVHLLDKNKITSYNIHSKPFTELEGTNLRDDGFVTLAFDEDMMKKLKPIYDLTNSLSPSVADDDAITRPIKQKTIDYIQQWVGKKYAELTGMQNFEVLCSRNLIMRIAGCDDKSCHVPGNPLFHLDFIDFEKTYERQCLDQEKYKTPNKCPPLEYLVDVINIWFPTQEIQDWPLGFINNENIEIRDYVPVQIVSGSRAASMRYKDGLTVSYKKGMKTPEVYMFRSATENVDKKGTFHGSFRISEEPILRYSVEIRCCIFRNETVVGGKKTRKLRKYYRINKTYKN